MIETRTQSLISFETIERAASMLRALAPHGSDVILFGSYARGDAGPDSDLDFLVVEPKLTSRHAEMVRLRQALRPLRIPVDVLVVSRKVFEEWKFLPNNVAYEANLEGKNMSQAPTPAQLSLSKARGDLYVAGKLKDDPNVAIEQYGFQCQQAIEKSIKAVLSQHAVRYRTGHDLASYLDLLTAAGKPYPVELDKSIELTPFGARLRYDDLPDEEERALALDRQAMYDLAAFAVNWAAGIVPGA